MKPVLLIRHGATEGNLKKRYIGRTDEPLCPAGIAQLNLLSTPLPRCDFIFSSPLLRCRQTAELLFPQQPVLLTEGLKECDFGIFEGLTATELNNNPAYAEWLKNGCTSPIPGGEDIKAFKSRVTKAFLDIILSLPDYHTVAFVMHGGCIMSILEHFCPGKGNFYDFHIDNGQWVSCNFQDNILTITGGALC